MRRLIEKSASITNPTRFSRRRGGGVSDKNVSRGDDPCVEVHKRNTTRGVGWCSGKKSRDEREGERREREREDREKEREKKVEATLGFTRHVTLMKIAEDEL